MSYPTKEYYNVLERLLYSRNLTKSELEKLKEIDKPLKNSFNELKNLRISRNVSMLSIAVAYLHEKGLEEFTLPNLVDIIKELNLDNYKSRIENRFGRTHGKLVSTFRKMVKRNLFIEVKSYRNVEKYILNEDIIKESDSIIKQRRYSTTRKPIVEYH